MIGMWGYDLCACIPNDYIYFFCWTIVTQDVSWLTWLQLMLSDGVQKEDLQTHCPFPMVWSATTEPLQDQRQSTSVMMAFTRMVQQQGCARVVVYGMVVYLSAYQIKEDKMVNILCLFIIIRKW